MSFIVFDKNSSNFLVSKCKKMGLGGSLGSRDKADYFDTENQAMAEVKWLVENDYLPYEGIYCAIPKDSIILLNP